MREVSCSENPLQGKPPQAGEVARKKIFLSTGTELRHDIKGKLFVSGKQVVLA